jgi:hypothetical protein
MVAIKNNTRANLEGSRHEAVQKVAETKVTIQFLKIASGGVQP